MGRALIGREEKGSHPGGQPCRDPGMDIAQVSREAGRLL